MQVAQVEGSDDVGQAVHRCVNYQIVVAVGRLQTPTNPYRDRQIDGAQAVEEVECILRADAGLLQRLGTKQDILVFQQVLSDLALGLVFASPRWIA